MRGCGFNRVIRTSVLRRRAGKHPVDNLNILFETPGALGIVPIRDADHAVSGVNGKPQPETDFDAPPRAVLDGARSLISILEMLRDKTEGRRTAEEEKVLEGLLFELRMAYVEKTREGGS